MTNPYWGKTFFQFFGVFIARLWEFLRGHLSFQDIASDEVQMLVLGLTAISCGLLGTFLVLKKMAMMANALSHTLLLGIVCSFLFFMPSGSEGKGDFFYLSFPILISASLFTGLLTSFFTQLLHRGLKLHEDASIGLVFTILFALGIVVVTLYTKNMHIGIEAVMGNVDALHPHDAKLALTMAGLNIVAILFFYRSFQISAFDPVFSRSVGMPTIFFESALLLLTAGTVISAFRAVGVILVLCLLVGPVLIARRLTHRLRVLLFLAVCIGIVSSLISVALSRHILTVTHIPLSTAGIEVGLIAFCYFILLVIDRGFRRK